MKQFIMTIAMLMPLISQAFEMNDTTLTIGNDSIRICQDKGKTTVRLYNRQGNEMRKTREVEFVDGQEIERVYVTSPFIPQTIGSGKSRKQLKSHYPLFFIGFNQIPGSIMASGGNAALQTLNSKSWEWGLTLTTIAFSLNNTTAITSAFSIGRVHNHFKGNNILTTDGGVTTMRTAEGAELQKSYISYTVSRVPFMIEWQNHKGNCDLFAAVGASVELRFRDRSRYKIDGNTTTETNDINMNPLGLNLEFHAGCGIIMIYGRAAVTPLLNKSNAPECYPVSFGVGVRI